MKRKKWFRSSVLVRLFSLLFCAALLVGCTLASTPALAEDAPIDTQEMAISNAATTTEPQPSESQAATEPQPTAPYSSEEALREILQGKRLSILGDSISTFPGWSNSTAANDTLGKNVIYYPRYDVTSADETWWKQAADRYGMEILVNNSWSGSSVTNQRDPQSSYGYNTRPGNLHRNVDGEAMPDIIVIYMGTNDIWVSCSTDVFDPAFWERIEAEGFAPASKSKFEESCALMVYKVRTHYPDAEIFLFNNPTMDFGYEENRLKFNAAFAAIAARYGCHVVDLHSSPISDYAAYTGDGIHPNAAGMDIMTEVFADSLKAVYLP